ncbi:MAG: AsmA family protein [bacterium]
MKYKKAIIYSVLTFIIIIAILFVLPFVINLDKYIPKITAPISKAIGRQVSIQHVRLTILSGLGVELKSVRVEEKKPSQTPFVQVDDIDVGVKLLPLLKKQISISKIILTKPEINIIRYPDGVYNFTDILKKETEKPAEKITSTTKTSTGIPEGFYLDRFVISDGTINITNIEEGKEHRYSLNHINLGVYGFNVKQAFRVSLGVSMENVKEARLDIDGYVGPTGQHISMETLPLNLNVSLKHVDIPYILSIVGAKSRILTAGTIDVEEKLKTDSGVMHIDGSINLSGLTLTNGTINPCSITNQLEYVLKDKNLNMRNITFKSEGIELGINGNANVGTKVVNINLVSKQLSLDKVLGFYSPLKQSLPKDVAVNGEGGIKTYVNMANNVANVNGVIDLTNAKISYSKMFSKPSGIPMSLSYNISKDEAAITLKGIKFVLDKLAMDASGRVALDKDMNGAVNINTNNIKIASLEDVIPYIKQYQARGSFILTMNASGPFKKAKELNAQGRLQVKDVSANITSLPKPLNSFNMDTFFTRNSVNIKTMLVRIGNSEIMGNGNINNFSAPEGKINITSPYLDVDELTPASKPKEVQPKENVTPKEQEKPSILDKADISLTANVKKGVVKKAQFSNLSMQARLVKGEIVLNRFYVDIFSGMLAGSGTVNMKGQEPYDLKLKAASLNLGDMLNTLTSYKDIMSGRLGADVALNGNAKDLKHTVSGKGILTITDGEIKTFSMLSSLLGIAKLANIGNGKTTKISSMRLTAAIDHGRVTSNDTKLINSDLTVVASGYFDLDANLDYKGTGILSRAISNRVGGTAGQLIKNEHGEIEIPFILTGTIRKPVFKLDAAVYEQKLKEAAKRQVIQELNKQLNKELQNNNIQQNKSIQELENKGKKAIEQLFR